MTPPKNCWNIEADAAESIGFPVVKTICPSCPHRLECRQTGYLRQLIAAKEATVALCTHKRVEFSGFPELTANRRYVSIHENPVDLLRPRLEVIEADLQQIQEVLHRLLNDPRLLDWFADDLRVDDEGNRYHDSELAIRKDRQYEFCRLLADLVEGILQDLRITDKTVEWRPRNCKKQPEGIERTLYFATRVAKARFDGQPWRFVLAAATGELFSSALLVAKRFVKGGVIELHKTAVGFRRNQPSRESSTWFNDATITIDRLESILGEPVHDQTPDGRLPLQKKAVQILRDVTRRTSIGVVGNVIRGVLADRLQFRRVGIICHRPHLKAINVLGTEFAARIVKTTYFGSGEDRSSNAWHEECDLVLVCGTPRMPPDVVAAYLIQVGEVAAACREPVWGAIHWEGRTESGEPLTVAAIGYHDDIWRRGHRDLVRAALVQAIGRGRGILVNGCEVIVLSNEECGLVVSDTGLETLNGSSVKVLDALTRLTMENAKYIYLGKSIVSTVQIARATGLSIVRVRELLRDLERRGLALKVGERGGWLSVTNDVPEHPTSTQPASLPGEEP